MAGTSGCVFEAYFAGNIMTVTRVNVLTGFLERGTSISATFPSGNTIDAVITEMADSSSAEITYTVDSRTSPILDTTSANGIQIFTLSRLDGSYSICSSSS